MKERLETERRLKGVAISPGIAHARVCLFDEGRHGFVGKERIADGAQDGEVKRLDAARHAVVRQLEQLRTRVEARIGKAEGEIFSAQALVLDDPQVIERMARTIREERDSAEAAVAQVLDFYEIRVRQIENERVRERASDIAEIKRRLLDRLMQRSRSLRCTSGEHCQRGRHRIVVARELTPGLTVELQTEDLRGFVTEHGGVTSHAAILARAMGIPAVSGIAGVYEMLSCGEELLVDGDSGEVVLWPARETLAKFPGRLAKKVASEPDAVAPVRGLTVMASISLSHEVSEARRAKADGIGLYRTEFEFLAAGRVLGEEEQYQRYRAVVRGMGGRPVTIRLLDMGGDKGAAFLDLPQEANPGLGFRGARLLLGRPDLLAPQARAIARASREGPVNVLYPMIVDLDQFRLLRRRFDEAVGRRRRGTLRHGVMFEVPSACLQARAILEEADFGSIGTNDLVQYLFAVDRNNELVASDFTPDRPVLWEMLRGIVLAGRRTGKPISLCGEIGGDARYLARLRTLGIHSISASVPMIPRVRRAAHAQANAVRRDASRRARSNRGTRG